MNRLSLILLVVVCFSMSVSMVIAQEEAAPVQEDDNAGATIKVQVIDVSPQQRPIAGVTVKIVNSATGKEYIVTTDKDGVYEKKGLPAGRYTISASKDGYGDRFGKSKVVAAGGEVFYKIKMKRRETLLTFFFRRFGLVSLSFIFIFISIFAAA